MPSIEEIRTALGKMSESSAKLPGTPPNINENVNSYSEQLFAPIEQLESEIRDKDKIIESLKNKSTELKNQVAIAEKENSTILEELEKSRWLESKVALATKKVYDDKVKSIINKNVDSKIIPVLTAVARRKQGNQQLNWGNWLKIPESKYLFQINKSIAKGIFEDINALISRRLDNESTRGSGGSTTTKLANNYSLTFTGNTAATGTSDYVSTTFNPDDYNLNEGFTLSYWVRPDELGSTMMFGRKPANSQRLQFGIQSATQMFIGVGSKRIRTNAPHGMVTGTWYHWAITYVGQSNGKTPKGYKDGDLMELDAEGGTEATATWSATGGGPENTVFFGGYNAYSTEGYTAGWACGLDEVSIFDEVKDVSTLYNGGIPSDLSSESGLVGYWRFENGSGTTATDLSGNGNHGTLTTDDTGLPDWSTDTP